MLYLHDLIQASKAILRPEKLLFPSYRRGNGGTEKLRGSRFNPAPPVETSQTPEAALDRLRQARTPAEAGGDSKDHRNFKSQINHATWGDQTGLNTYDVDNSVKVLKVSVRRCWVKHIAGKKQETYLSISERHNLWKENLG
uniref:Uncharacterized protein n=1 Tax=Rousettus aegyptiacus TaxID=9407 RepID=A0A7J8CHQ5_ROUAE|nr:hypothetical protein HJG63_008933 [Rousettus aegyptiacus]